MSRTYPEDFGFGLSHFVPKETGLAVKVWADGNGERKTWEPQLYVADPYDGFAVSISDKPAVVHGIVSISHEDLADIFAWVILNKGALLDYWNGLISTLDLVDRLKSDHNGYAYSMPNPTYR